MEKAKKVENPDGEIIRCKMTDSMVKSSIEILSAEVLEKKKSLEEEDIIVVADAERRMRPASRSVGNWRTLLADSWHLPAPW